MSKRFLGTADTARYLEITKPTVIRKIKSGELGDVEMVGRSYGVPAEVVASLIRERIARDERYLQEIEGDATGQ